MRMISLCRPWSLSYRCLQFASWRDSLGSLVGLGGGIIVVPALTLFYGIDIRYAIGASIVSVIATSSGAAAAYVREGMTNLRMAMFLEIGTTTGAISGAFLAGILHGPWLYVIFGRMLAVSAVAMLRERGIPSARPPDAWADRLRLHGSYFDESQHRKLSIASRTPGSASA